MGESLAAAAAAAARCRSRPHSPAAFPSMMLLLLAMIPTIAQSYTYSSAHDAKDVVGTPTWASNPPQLISPSANDHVDLYRYACANNTQRVGRREMVMRYATAPSERLRQLAAKWNPSRECRREESAWRYNYFDELDSVLVRERSIDARAANVLYLARQVKPLSIDFYTYNWGDPRADLENMRRVAGPKVDDERCGRELRHMLELIADLGRRVGAIRNQSGAIQALGNDIKQNTTTVLTDSHISLAKILDSYGRYDSGLLFGKVFAPGSYHQCIGSKLIVSAEHKVGMRFCWAHLNTRKHLDVSLRAREKTRFETEVDALLSGICVPESCHSKSFAQYKREFQELVNSQFRLPRLMYIDEQMEVNSIYCLVDEDSEFTIPLAGKLLICFLVSWCVLVFSVSLWNQWRPRIATTTTTISGSDSGNHQAKGRKVTTILDHLDLGNSWNDFMDDHAQDKSRLLGGVQLDTLNVIKVFGCAFVVLGHTMAIYLSHSMDEVRMTKYIESQPAVTLILAGTMVVDTFFVITGILWSYFMLKRINKHSLAQRDFETSELPGADLNNNNSKSVNLNKFTAAASQQVTTCFVDDAKQVAALEEQEQEQGPTMPLDDKRPEAHASANESAHLSWRPARGRPIHTGWRAFCISWFQYSFIRYLKIIPLYIIVHWFKKYVFIYAGTGPFWDHGLNERTMSGTCHKETPLTPFTFLAAYYPLSRQCIFQSWSVANDIFFALLAPPVILLMNKRPRTAACLSLLSCSIILAFAQHGLAQVPPQVDEEIRELRSFGFYRFFDEISKFYTAPHYRIFCFLVGVWAGYFVYVRQVDMLKRQRRRMSLHVSHHHRHHLLETQVGQVIVPTCTSSPVPSRRNNVCADLQQPGSEQTRQFQPLSQCDHDCPPDPSTIERIEWPWWIRGPGTWFAIGYVLIMPLVFAYNDAIKIYLDPIYRYTYTQFLSTMRIVWASANAILFVRIMTDWKDTVPMRLSASRFWQIFVKINYAMLLVHLDMVIYTIESSPSMPDSFTKWGFFNLGAGVYLACIPLSIFAHVVFENPINRLIRSLLPSR